MTKKCFSNCRKRNQRDCNSVKRYSKSHCRYVTGNKYKYCRLGYNYKMDENCVPIIKTPTIKKKISIKKNPVHISPELSSNKKNFLEQEEKPNKEQIEEFEARVKKSRASRKIGNLIKKNITKRRAMKKIGKFFKNVNPNKRRAYFLKSVCSDSGVCIAFGKEANTIKKHFKNFSDFNYLVGDAKTIGSVSNNGFVKELEYEHEGYKAFTILKTSAQDQADNLLYEAYVGNYLNRVGLQYPCFLETYGSYKYLNEAAFLRMKYNKKTPIEVLQAGLNEIKNIETIEQIKEACQSPILSHAIMIQHLKDAETLRSKLTDVNFLKDDLLYILFQVYIPLALLRNTFTHYDLHIDNILLYEPIKGSYIEYHYDIQGTILSFKSKYIAKIIDYGRCFFNDDENNTFSGSSSKIYKEICSVPSCVPKCGYNVGFGWLQHNPRSLPFTHYISSQIPNRSHDLRALKLLSEMPSDQWKHIPKELQNILKAVHYTGEYGTADSASGLPTKVKNVLDVLSVLLIIQKKENVDKNNLVYEKLNKIGNLYIYSEPGKLMKYEPTM